MEYQRKIRWANYQTVKCKEYLRNDFSHQCAYCKLQEKELGIIDTDYFEVDHFRPQSDDTVDFNIHLYPNLYYCCKKCNSEKSDKWSKNLLDPCKDDIFSGSCPPIVGGHSPENNYKYISKTKQGKEYINTFKLNSRYNIGIRKRRITRENNILEIDKLIAEVIHKINNNPNIPNQQELSNLLEKLREKKNEAVAELTKDSNFEGAQVYLSERNVTNMLIFEEFNMDFKVVVANQDYYCELIVDASCDDSDIKSRYIPTEKLNCWKENVRHQIGILYYYPNLNKMYFYDVSKMLESTVLGDLGVKVKIRLSSEMII